MDDYGNDTEVEVSGWAIIRDEPEGRDPNKRWIAADPDSLEEQHWLWKSRPRTGGGTESALTDCAEVFVSRLAALLRVPAADCRFAVCDGELGVISRNVAPEGFSLNNGATYLPEVAGYTRRSIDSGTGERIGPMHRDRGYSLDAVEQVLTDVAPPPGVTEFTAFGVWVERVIALDAADIRGTLEAPTARMSQVASTFMERVILENRRRLCDVDIAEG